MEPSSLTSEAMFLTSEVHLFPGGRLRGRSCVDSSNDGVVNRYARRALLGSL